MIRISKEIVQIPYNLLIYIDITNIYLHVKKMNRYKLRKKMTAKNNTEVKFVS